MQSGVESMAGQGFADAHRPLALELELQDANRGIAGGDDQTIRGGLDDRSRPLDGWPVRQQLGAPDDDSAVASESVGMWPRAQAADEIVDAPGRRAPVD